MLSCASRHHAATTIALGFVPPAPRIRGCTQFLGSRAKTYATAPSCPNQKLSPQRTQTAPRAGHIFEPCCPNAFTPPSAPLWTAKPFLLGHNDKAAREVAPYSTCSRPAHRRAAKPADPDIAIVPPESPLQTEVFASQPISKWTPSAGMLQKLCPAEPVKTHGVNSCSMPRSVPKILRPPPHYLAAESPAPTLRSEC